MNTTIQAINEQMQRESAFVQALLTEIGRVIVGQERLVERLLIALLANGHILIEGVPGLAKTLVVNTLADAIHLNFQRLQFTPDLLPADLIGTQIYNPRTSEFTPRPGPIFANLILADEINRAPAKVQSALLEAMQERQVTIGDTTYRLEEPFLVMATQNPVEQEGTYPLPEAQVDRFMLKVLITHPTRAEEREILRRMSGEPLAPTQPVVRPEQILQARQLLHRIYVDPKIEEYILDLVFATREPAQFGLVDLPPWIEHGASPRATIFLVKAARAHAFLHQRGYVTPEDVKQVAPDVLRHRLLITFEAEAEGVDAGQIVQQILNGVDVP